MTRRGLRIHIGIFGRRNSGKSSLLNAITGQSVSIVSEIAGTTTDPVEKTMEFLPLGPVVFIDTAGIDDVGALGKMRIAKTRRIFDRTNLAIIVSASGEWGLFEESLLKELTELKVPSVIVFNKADQSQANQKTLASLQGRGLKVVHTIATEGVGVPELRQALLDTVPADYLNNPDMIGDLVAPGQLAVLVVPIDKEAPKGRLIVPQVQAIRNLLDNDSLCMVVKEHDLRKALNNLKQNPALVVTDSQAFLKVAADTPSSILMTSFSILLARMQGDLSELVSGAMAIDKLRPGDRILIAEACSHHPIEEDIGRVKIPKWLNQYVGGKLEISHVQGHDFKEDISSYKLVIHCGACMTNRREMLSRILKCKNAGVPITNYGLTIAYSLGVFERALEAFPDVLKKYRDIKNSQSAKK
ncbi:MAG: [FeFe] hydrogenase H-cluster maturation GTPase HydF [SAR324 cluster bacterium]|uniref:[FeFe] hydrogenase H-cluster maturation GTPase HydF n=1 Tax=SAR324 cluster bacterium TaxID=2024889 RepID=A0A7X9FUV5_9DELT|nr:[FeFe] hydrogenase H-cluster maturation GTPase HydF [SAR324 cluster bacterium]